MNLISWNELRLDWNQMNAANSEGSIRQIKQEMNSEVRMNDWLINWQQPITQTSEITANQSIQSINSAKFNCGLN